MFWQEDDKPRTIDIPDDIVDLVFDIACRELPVDHACALSQAIYDCVPTIHDDGRCGVHAIHMAGSQNGWERPDPRLGQTLMPSRRTKLTLRVPRERVAEVEQALVGRHLDIAGYPLTVGPAKQKKLSSQGTLFARHMVLQDGEAEDEHRFLQRIVSHLADRGIRVKKALCGKTSEFEGPAGPVQTRSIMIAGLTIDESLQLQQQGVGPLRHMGCGIFIPHKGIDSVRKTEEET